MYISLGFIFMVIIFVLLPPYIEHLHKLDEDAKEKNNDIKMGRYDP